MIYGLPILGVLLSFVFVLAFKPEKNLGIRLLLAFSGSFLLAITIFELLPEVYLGEHSKSVGIYILLGILLQIFLEFFSKGAEHGHLHRATDSAYFPWLLFLSLSLHAFLEGIPIGGNTPVLYAVLVHKVPIAVILSIFLLNSKFDRRVSVAFIVLFALMTPAGTFLAQNTTIFMENTAPLTAIVIGVFLHISTVILFESAEGHSFNLRKLFVILLGMVVAYFL